MRQNVCGFKMNSKAAAFFPRGARLPEGNKAAALGSYKRKRTSEDMNRVLDAIAKFSYRTPSCILHM